MRGSLALVLTRRVLHQMRRDKRTLALLILQPLVIMAIFGYAFGGDVSGVKVAVANLDRGTFGAKVLAHLDREVVDVVEHATEAEVERAVRNREARMGVVIPLNFTRNIEAAPVDPDAEPAVLVLYKDNTNLQVTGPAQEAFADAFRDAMEDEFDRASTFEMADRVVFGSEDGSNLEFLVPGIAAFAIFMMGSMLTVVTLVKERTLGTLSRILASPITRAEVVVGFSAAFALVSLVQAAVVIGVAAFVFRVPVQGSVLLALLTTTLVGVTALGLGILISGLASNEFQAVQSVSLVSFPSMFLSGVFAPMEAMPWFLRPLSDLVPLTYAVNALRDILNHGAGLAQVAWPLLVLALFAALFLGAATLTFGRRAA